MAASHAPNCLWKLPGCDTETIVDSQVAVLSSLPVYKLGSIGSLLGLCGPDGICQSSFLSTENLWREKQLVETGEEGLEEPG